MQEHGNLVDSWRASSAEMTALVGTLVKSAILARSSSEISFSQRHQEDVRLDTDASELLDRVLGRLGLGLVGRLDEGDQGQGA